MQSCCSWPRARAPRPSAPGDAASGSPAAHAMHAAPGVGSCWDVPPAHVFLRSRDGLGSSPQVGCGSPHTTQVVLVLKLPRPTDAEAMQHQQTCLSQVISFVGTDEDPTGSPPAGRCPCRPGTRYGTEPPGCAATSPSPARFRKAPPLPAGASAPSRSLVAARNGSGPAWPRTRGRRSSSHWSCAASRTPTKRRGGSRGSSASATTRRPRGSGRHRLGADAGFRRRNGHARSAGWSPGRAARAGSGTPRVAPCTATAGCTDETGRRCLPADHARVRGRCVRADSAGS